MGRRPRHGSLDETAARGVRARARRSALPIVLVVVFVLKLIVLLQLADHPLLQPTAAGGLDTQYYLQLAQRVAGGDLLLGPGLYFVSPLYIYFLAPLLVLGGGSLFFIKVVQIVLGTSACALVWLSAREWFSPRAAWIALGLTALTGAFTFYEVVLLQAALDPVLSALDLVLFTYALRNTGRRWSVLCGAALGIHVLNRPNMLLVACGLVLVLLMSASRRRRGVALVAGLAMALTPIAVRNTVTARTFSPTPSHGGLNFYIGNNPDADGTYHSVAGITPNIAGQAEDARRVAQGAERRSLSDAEVSSYFVRRGLAWWRSDPSAAAELFARKVAYTVNHSWLTLNYSYPFYQGESPVLGVLAIGPLVLVPLGLAGLVAHRLAGQSPPEGFTAWSMFAPFTILSIAVFFVSSRYRVPLLVMFCVTGGGLVDVLWASVVQRRWRPLLVAAALVIPAAAVAAADYGLDDGRREEETQMGLALLDRHDWDRARMYLARAESGHADPGRFHARVGDAQMRAGRYADAIAHFEAAQRLGALDARSTYQLALAYGLQGRTADAARTLDGIRSGELRDPQLREAVADACGQVGLDLAREGKFEEAIEPLRRAVALAPARPAGHLNLAVAYAETGRRDLAGQEVRRALALDPSYQRAKDLLAALSRR